MTFWQRRPKGTAPACEVISRVGPAPFYVCLRRGHVSQYLGAGIATADDALVWTRQFQLLRLRSTLVSLAASGAAELIGRRLDAARESVVLNEYHLKFLDHLIRYNVRFMVIGGQARRFQSPSHKTTDLDIWVSLAPGDRKSLEAALASWSRLHPQHTNQPLVPPLNLRPNVQIHFPETDGVFYLDRSDRMAQVDAEQGVDVLTSLGDLEFDLAMSRAEMATVEGLTVNYLGLDDLERI